MTKMETTIKMKRLQADENKCKEVSETDASVNRNSVGRYSFYVLDAVRFF